MLVVELILDFVYTKRPDTSAPHGWAGGLGRPTADCKADVAHFTLNRFSISGGGVAASERVYRWNINILTSLSCTYTHLGRILASLRQTFSLRVRQGCTRLYG